LDQFLKTPTTIMFVLYVFISPVLQNSKEKPDLNIILHFDDSEESFAREEGETNPSNSPGKLFADEGNRVPDKTEQIGILYIMIARRTTAGKK
jgi:hypothetical protein